MIQTAISNIVTDFNTEVGNWQTLSRTLIDKSEIMKINLSYKYEFWKIGKKYFPHSILKVYFVPSNVQQIQF